MDTSATLILSRHDVQCALSLGECIEAVEQAFAQAAHGRMDVPPVVHIAAQQGAFHVKSAAYSEAPHHVAVKVNGNFPDNPARRGLPTIQGAILLCDTRNGRLLSIMDSIELTTLRTGAATAVAAKFLAPNKIGAACLIGCGVQGRIQLLSLLEVLTLDHVYAADADPQRAKEFAEEMQQEVDCEVEGVDDFADVAPGVQVIVTCTPARLAFLQSRHVSPGTFIAAVGADNHDKQEIDPILMAQARVVADNIDQCLEMGDLRHAIAAGVMSRDDVAAELGDVVAGRVHLDITKDDIVVFDSTGIAIQDVAAAGVVYERSKANGVGTMAEIN